MKLDAKHAAALAGLALLSGALVAARANDVPPPAGFDIGKALAAIREKIKGRENEPAETVFANIETLKGVPAGRVLPIMMQGYSRALGVRCIHCHVLGEWEKDDKKPKLVARRMAALATSINEELSQIDGLSSEKPTVNCATCHRGDVKPALSVPEK